MARLEKWSVLIGKSNLGMARSGIVALVSDKTGLDAAAVYAAPGYHLVPGLEVLPGVTSEYYLLGIISDREGFKDGDIVTTSEIVEVAEDFSYAITASGTRYDLGEQYFKDDRKATVELLENFDSYEEMIQSDQFKQYEEDFPRRY